MRLLWEVAGFAVLIAAIPCVVLSVMFAALAVLDRGATRLDRVLADAERDRVDAMWADPAFTAEMERRVTDA